MGPKSTILLNSFSDLVLLQGGLKGFFKTELLTNWFH